MATTIISRGLGFVVASYTAGGGTPTTVSLGFVPAFVWAQNVTNGGTAYWWFSTTTSSSEVHFASTAAGIAQLGTVSRGAGGITELTGSDGTGIGYLVGTDTVINATSHAYRVMAWRPG